MDHEPPETLLPLGHATVVLQAGDVARRFRVNAAILTPQGRHRVHLTFEGPEGAVTIDLPRVVFWRLTSLFHERSAAADFRGPTQPGKRTRGKHP